MTVLDSRISKSKPSLGLVRFHFDMVNQADEKVLGQTNWVMFATREAEPVSGESSSVPNAAAKSRPEPRPGGESRRSPPIPFSRISSSARRRSWAPTPSRRRTSSASPGSSIRSPSMWMRRPRRAACSGPLRLGLAYGGVWMKRMVGYRDRTRTDALARGERPAPLGPSPGFSNLKWLKPVYAGDTIAYRSTVTAKRASASRPGWGLVFHHNTGTNQHGEEVFAFDGMVFWERRA